MVRNSALNRIIETTWVCTHSHIFKLCEIGADLTLLVKVTFCKPQKHFTCLCGVSCNVIALQQIKCTGTLSTLVQGLVKFCLDRRINVYKHGMPSKRETAERQERNLSKLCNRCQKIRCYSIHVIQIFQGNAILHQ